MAASPHYRPMRTADLEAVARIECEAHSHPWSRGNFADSLAAGHSCWVVESGGGLVAYGVLLVGAGEAHLLNLSVWPPAQGRGTGRGLLAFFEARAREMRCGTMLLEVRKSNARARHLYQAAGFVELGVRPRFYPASEGREDAVIMGKDL